MSIPIYSAACAIGIALATMPSEAHAGDAQAATQEPPAVIELFTSQGCSSCPPADALFGDYAKREGVIALSFHVDYWDYLGWQDRFASADFSERQRQYARARGDGAVYTPQAVVNGRGHVVGSSDASIEAALGAKQSVADAVHVRAAVTETSLDIRVEPANPWSIDADILLAIVQSSATVKIKRGENAGKTITYRNIVRSLTRIGGWDGTAATLAQPIPVAGGVDGASYVVLVQRANAGPILGATVARDTR